MSTYLRPTAEIAPRALLTPNPAEAMALAQELIDGPLMANHNHGLWGYSGPAKADGAQLTIQSTGIGGPSAAAVLFDLARHGVQRAVCVGRAEPLNGAIGAGARVLVIRALRRDGASRALGEGPAALPHPELCEGLRASLGEGCVPATVASLDVRPADPADAGADGALAWDLASAAVLAAGERAGVAAGVALLAATGDPEASREGLLELGAAGAQALLGAAVRG